MINYLIDSNAQPNYERIKTRYDEMKKRYEEIKAMSSDYLILDNVILVSSNRYSNGPIKFIELRETYIGKNIKLFFVRENEIMDIVGPITLVDNEMFSVLISWIFEFIGTDQYFDFDEKVNKYFVNYNYPKEKIVFYN